MATDVMGIGLDQGPAYLLSATRIPPSPNLRPGRVGRLHWFCADSEENYRKRPHPALGPEDVVYQINSDGYRCAELAGRDWASDPSIRIVGIGSSGLFGAALPEENTCLAVLADRLRVELGRPVTYWNLSNGGSSADYVSRMLFSVLPVMRPHLLVLTAFPINRRELFGDSGRPFIVDARPHWQHRLLDPERSRLHRAARTVCNPYNNLMNLLVNMKTWESLCDDAGVPWLFMTEAYTRHIEGLLPMLRKPRKVVGPGMHALIEAHRNDPTEGLARDMMHAGKLPNRLMAEQLLETLKALYPAALASWRKPAPDDKAAAA